MVEQFEFESPFNMAAEIVSARKMFSMTLGQVLDECPRDGESVQDKADELEASLEADLPGTPSAIYSFIVGICSADAERLSSVIDIIDDPPDVWYQDDLKELMAALMATPLETAFAFADEAMKQKIGSVEMEEGTLRQRFSDVLHDIEPDLKLLKLVKSFSKRMKLNEDAPIPESIAVAVYFATVAAMIRTGKASMSLSEEELVAKIEEVSDQPFVDAETQALLEDGMAFLAFYDK
jgi:hypothetical protein